MITTACRFRLHIKIQWELSDLLIVPILLCGSYCIWTNSTYCIVYGESGRYDLESKSVICNLVNKVQAVFKLQYLTWIQWAWCARGGSPACCRPDRTSPPAQDLEYSLTLKQAQRQAASEVGSAAPVTAAGNKVSSGAWNLYRSQGEHRSFEPHWFPPVQLHSKVSIVNNYKTYWRHNNCTNSKTCCFY